MAGARRAVVLLSGGMDSAVALGEARAVGFESYALTVAYGQRHAVELEAARRVARALGASEHKVLALDLAGFGGSALTQGGQPGAAGAAARLEVPKDRAEGEIGSGGVPPTYVPARNAVLLSLALSWAEALGARDLYIGVNAVDHSGYPDCRGDFVAAFARLAGLATAAGAERGERFHVRAPLLKLSKAEIVLRAEELGVDLALTHTCYDPRVEPAPTRGLAPLVLACGRCDACLLRLKGFREAGRRDPAAYV
jgi:7-cyano-7-deazaguanine synthase